MADEFPLGSIVHVELYSHDLDKTKRFYEQVFGWKFSEIPGTDYNLIEMPGRPHGGLLARPKKGPFEPPSTLNYVLVKSVDEATQRILAAGGKILKPKYTVPGVGTFSVFEAPGGIVHNVFEPAKGSPLLR